MTQKEQLEAAIADLSNLTEPDRAADCAVALALPQWPYGDRMVRFFNAGPRYEGAGDSIGITDINDDWQSVPGVDPTMLVPRFTESYDAAFRLAGNETHRRIECGTNVPGDCWAYACLGDSEGGEGEAYFNEPTAICVAILICIAARLDVQEQEEFA